MANTTRKVNVLSDTHNPEKDRFVDEIIQNSLESHGIDISLMNTKPRKEFLQYVFNKLSIPWKKDTDFQNQENIQELVNKTFKNKMGGSEMVDYRKIIINKEAQRPRNDLFSSDVFVRTMTNFNIHAFDAIELCELDGKLYCTDGQGRLLACRLAYPELTMFPATIRTVSCWKDVVYRYIIRHEQNQFERITTADDFETAMQNGDKIKIELWNILFGYEFNRIYKNKDKGKVMYPISSNELGNLITATKRLLAVEENKALWDAFGFFKKNFLPNDLTDGFAYLLCNMQKNLKDYNKWHNKLPGNKDDIVNFSLKDVMDIFYERGLKFDGESDKNELVTIMKNKYTKQSTNKGRNQTSDNKEIIRIIANNITDEQRANSKWFKTGKNMTKTYFSEFRDYLYNKTKNEIQEHLEKINHKAQEEQKNLKNNCNF